MYIQIFFGVYNLFQSKFSYRDFRICFSCRLFIDIYDILNTCLKRFIFHSQNITSYKNNRWQWAGKLYFNIFSWIYLLMTWFKSKILFRFRRVFFLNIGTHSNNSICMYSHINHVIKNAHHIIACRWYLNA